MTTKCMSWLASATLTLAGLALAVTAASAQTRDAPGMSGCPDGLKGDGVTAAQPVPGGGCEDTVYSTDDNRTGTRGGAKSSKPAAKPDVAREPPKTKTQRERE